MDVLDDGLSRAGKSTIIALLQGFYKPQSGTILIDDVPLEDWDLEHYRRSVGVVMQEPRLFNMSIRDNIVYGLEAGQSDV